MSESNKVKVVEYDLWDSETGEADIVVEFENGKKIKAFTIDSFHDIDDVVDVNLSLFCKSFEIADNFTSEILNLNDKYEARVQGKIIKYINDEEKGEYIVVDAGNIFVSIFDDFSEQKKIESSYFKGQGRLDIEIVGEEW